MNLMKTYDAIKAINETITDAIDNAIDSFQSDLRDQTIVVKGDDRVCRLAEAMAVYITECNPDIKENVQERLSA